jgi:DNA-3-methyladenine glycosylase
MAKRRSSKPVTRAHDSPIGVRWSREEFAGSAISLARRLLGSVLVRVLDDGTVLAGRIVETEAYLGVKDAASHAYRGRRTARNEVMYAGPGTAYVYFTYGMHYCMNVVCGEVGVPAAVLLRALEPLEGLDAMRKLRAVHPGKTPRGERVHADRDLCSGPARLCQAMAIRRELNGVDLVKGERLHIAHPGSGLGPVGRIVRTPRIGIGYAGDWVHKPLRFLVPNSAHVSGVKLGKSGKLARMERGNLPGLAPR